MRIPNLTASNALIARLQNLTTSQSNLQTQVATGQRFTQASDDPGTMAQVLNLQTEDQNLQQWSQNGATALSTSQASYAAVQQFQDISTRAGEIAALNIGTSGATSFASYATELNGLIEQAFQVANTQNGGQNLFGGTQTTGAPFTATRDASGQITGVTYSGSASAAQIQVGENSSVSPQTDGTTNQKFADFVNNLVTLRNALQSQSSTAVQAAQTGLNTSENDILVTVSEIGATQAQIQASQTMNQSRFTAVQQLISSDTSTDLATTAVKLTQTQTAYQAALQSGAQLLQHSLLDYIQ